MSELTDRANHFADRWHCWVEHRSLTRELVAEIERLRKSLVSANSQFEHFEREWYLRGDEIERLTADRQALLDSANKTAELVMRQGQQSIEQQAEIAGLTAALAGANDANELLRLKITE